MKALTVAVLGLLALSACSGDASTSSPTTAPATPDRSGSTTTVTPPPPATHVTFVIDEGRAEPIEVPGEPERHLDDAVVMGNADTVNVTLLVDVPPNWSSRGMVLASWSSGIGFHGWLGSLFPEIESRTHGPDFVYELWLFTEADGEPVRRLLRLETADLDGPYRVGFPPGYESVNDVLSKPPPSGGNYLVPVDTP